MIVWTQNSWPLAALLVCLACSGGNRAAGAPLASGGSGTKSIAASPSSAGEPAGGAESAGSAGGAVPQAAGSGGESDDAGGAPGAAGQGVAGEAEGGAAPWMEPEHQPICAGSGQLHNPKKLAISSAEVDQMGGISGDELVIVWTVVVGEEVTLHYAQRANAAAEFVEPEALVIPAASDSVSVSADGLRLVYVNADRKGFSQLVRTATDLPFELVDSRDFAVIQESVQLFASDEYVGDPVLAPDDMAFFYSRYGAGRRSTLLVTKRFSAYAPWPEGAPLPVSAELEATEAGRQRPTGVSLDLETLFLWDAAAGSQRVAVLAHDTRTFDLGLDLGDAHGAAPNSACSRVFYDSAGDLWTAELGMTP